MVVAKLFFLVAKFSFLGCGIVFFLVAESSFFGCGIVFFWLRKRLFLVAEACLILVAESPKFGCGSVEIWFRNRNIFPELTPFNIFNTYLNYLDLINMCIADFDE